MRFKEYLKEDGRNPKKGDKFQDKKGKKITIVSVGSGLISQAGDAFEVRVDGEKFTRDVPMKIFFKKFKYLKESVTDVENEIRNHLSGTPRKIDKKGMWRLIKTGLPGVKSYEFDDAWDGLVKEKYLIKVGKFYKWEM